MERTYVRDLQEKAGQEIRFQGFVKTIRKQGGIIFVILRDNTGFVQGIVFKKQTELFEMIKELPVETVVDVQAMVQEQPQAPGGFELTIQSLQVLSQSESPLPIPITAEKGNEASAAKRLDWRWLDLRDPENAKIFQVWTELERGFRDYFTKANFTQIYTPSFMNAPSESGAEVFTVNYFEGNAYLAQSPQFYKQMAMAAGLDRVFVVGPVFRAELSFTTRHMTEFTGWDFELSFIESHHDVMAHEEQLLISGFSRLKETVLPDIKVPTGPFPKLTMTEAKAKLAEAGIASEKAGDLSPEEERELSRIIEEETGSEFVFVTDYPIEVRPFYHMRHGEGNKLTKSFDLLYKGIEITTGAQREHRYDVLMAQAESKGMNIEQIQYYLDFFRYGCPPHGGVGIGPGRIVMSILGLPSVKEATFLPRDVKRLSP